MGHVRRLETKRCILKPLSSEYLSAEYLSWLLDEEVTKYMEVPKNYTFYALEKYLKEVEISNIFFWAIIAKSTNQNIGNIKIDPIDFEKKEGTYGIMIGNKNFWGKGIAREVSLEVIKFMFDEIGLKRIILGVLKENVGAIALYEKIGFRQVDLIEKFVRNDKTISTAVKMSISHEGISNK